MRILQTIIVLLAASLPARADVVILHDGRRIRGEIVERDEGSITLQRSNAAGNIHVTETIDAGRIARIIETDASPATQPAEPDPERAVTTRPADTGGMSSREKWALLDDAIARYQRGHYRDAGMRVSRLILESDDREHEAYDSLTREKLNLPLADLAADTHIRGAIDDMHGTKFRLRYVTDYEKPALSARLESLYRQWMAAGVDTLPEPDPAVPTTQPAASQPARTDGGLSVADWIEDPRAFEGSRRQRQALARRADLLINVLDEWRRIVHDPDRVDERLVMRNLDRSDLADFIAAMTGRRVEPAPETRVNLPRVEAPAPGADDAIEWLQQREQRRRDATQPMESMLEQRKRWLEMRRRAEYQQTLIDELGEETEADQPPAPQPGEPVPAEPPAEAPESNETPDTAQEQDNG